MNNKINIVQEIIAGIPNVPKLFTNEKDPFDYYYKCAFENGLDSKMTKEYTEENIIFLIDEVDEQFQNEYNLFWWALKLK